MVSAGPILFYDGECALCARSVQWVLARERDRTDLRFASLQGRLAAATLAGQPDAYTLNSVAWYQPAGVGAVEQVSLRSDAVLQTWRYVGGPWRVLAAVSAPVPRAVRDWLYDLIARHRHKLAGGPACLVPIPEQRYRFLDFQ